MLFDSQRSSELWGVCRATTSHLLPAPVISQSIFWHIVARFYSCLSLKTTSGNESTSVLMHLRRKWSKTRADRLAILMKLPCYPENRLCAVFYCIWHACIYPQCKLNKSQLLNCNGMVFVLINRISITPRPNWGHSSKDSGQGQSRIRNLNPARATLRQPRGWRKGESMCGGDGAQAIEVSSFLIRVREYCFPE